MSPTLRKAAKFGFVATIVICLFAFSCGNIHGSQCGPATIVAVLLWIPAMAVASVIGPDAPAIIVALFFLATFLWVTGLTLCVLLLRKRLASRREQTAGTDQSE